MSAAEIQSILSSLGSGDTVVFRPGVYRGGFTVSGVENVTLRGYGAVIDATGYSYGIDVGNSGGGVVIEGFRVIGGDAGAIYIHSIGYMRAYDLAVDVDGGDGIKIYAVSNIELYNISIQGTGDNGLYVWSAGGISAERISVAGGFGYGIRVGHASGVYLYASNITGCGVGIRVENAGLEIIYSVVSGNGVGVEAWNTGSLSMYFNRFMDNGVNAELHYVTESAFTTGEPIDYVFNGRSFHGVVGNYWGGVDCSDADGDGVGEEPVLVYNESGRLYYDTAPICPRFEAEAYRIRFITPRVLVVEAGDTVIRIPWRPGAEASFTAKATAWYVFDHPVLGHLSMRWPATMVLVNLTMTEVDGIRVASTARLLNYTVDDNRLVLVFGEKGYVAVASPRVYAAEVVYGNGSRRTLRPAIAGYMGEPWGLVEVGDPVNITLYLEPIPAPEPQLAPIMLLALLAVVLLAGWRRGR